jgi:nitrite reductase/ring-hydroxylating ferredoxin subunit
VGLLWTRVASLVEIEPAVGVRATVDGEPVVVFRIGNAVLALGARCPHQGNLLGTDLVEGTTAVCPSHGWSFDARTGEHVLFRGVRVPVYPTRVRGGEVFVLRRLLPVLREALRGRRLEGEG